MLFSLSLFLVFSDSLLFLVVFIDTMSIFVLYIFCFCQTLCFLIACYTFHRFGFPWLFFIVLIFLHFLSLLLVVACSHFFEFAIFYSYIFLSYSYHSLIFGTTFCTSRLSFALINFFFVCNDWRVVNVLIVFAVACLSLILHFFLFILFMQHFPQSVVFSILFLHFDFSPLTLLFALLWFVALFFYIKVSSILFYFS